MLLKLAWRSLMFRKGSVLLAVLSVAVSLFVLLGVEQVRKQARDSFNRTVSGVDLIVGARTGELNLLLYSVFRIGTPSNNISWQAYRDIAQQPRVAWTIPISLGDSHRGYRVVGTTEDFFSRYKYGQGRALALASGRAFEETFDVVLGASVAKQLEYQVGDSLVLAHGLGSTSFSMHEGHPFRVSGILEPTGTPVDRALYVSLEGIEAVHRPDADAHSDLTPSSITAFMLGLDSRVASFQLQRQINQYRGEPLLAILPGITLSQLWQMLGVVENILLLISAMVVLASLLGLSIMLLASMRERQRELALLRVIGAGPLQLFFLIQAEALLVVLLGAAIAVGAIYLGQWIVEPILGAQFGIYLMDMPLAGQSLILLAGVVLATLVVALIPASGAYRQSLQRGLQS
ncbi:ABC transporter permease [Microbulbifer flavimaris]|uniref:ABC transporter permease n=1 Tax=Microbulbifer flavimaris TaxID=1781068 RepID=A0ABX4HVC5_9GAMM|nr:MULTISPECIES: ABC transporter permease [Microbulbifer]KUJ78765.1 peptide ABC transporter permease [Microbulbifer sp. ZGT114]PCO04055.1 ABC transporter permease [Microbulbifer flavimaris]